MKTLSMIESKNNEMKEEMGEKKDKSLEEMKEQNEQMGEKLDKSIAGTKEQQQNKKQ